MRKSEPPISGVSNLLKQGWAPDYQHHSLTKSFHFVSEEPMKDFCLSILTKSHDKFTHLSAIELHSTRDVRVEIFSMRFQQETIDIARTIDSSYRETQEGNDDSSNDSIWSKWFKSISEP